MTGQQISRPASYEIYTSESWAKHHKSLPDSNETTVTGCGRIFICGWPADIYKAESWAVPKFQWSFCNSKLQDLYFVTGQKISRLASSIKLGSPEIWPEPAARLQWSFCNSKLQDLHFVTGKQIFRLASYAINTAESQENHCQSQLQGSNGASATASCRISILWLASRYPDQQAVKCIKQRARQSLYGKSQLQGSNGASATASCRIYILLTGQQIFILASCQI